MKKGLFQTKKKMTDDEEEESLYIYGLGCGSWTWTQWHLFVFISRVCVALAIPARWLFVPWSTCPADLASHHFFFLATISSNHQLHHSGLARIGRIVFRGRSTSIFLFQFQVPILTCIMHSQCTGKVHERVDLTSPRIAPHSFSLFQVRSAC